MVEHPAITPAAAPAAGRTDTDRLLRDLVVSHRRQLHAFILRRIGDAAEAEDLTQQAFLQAVTHIERFRGASQLSTWLFGIALNLVRNHLSRAPQRCHPHDTLDAAVELHADDADPALRSEQRRLAAQLLDALQTLPAEVRDVLLAVSIDELSYEQAAVMLSMPIGTVRSRVSRARSTLRARLDRAGG